MIQCYIACQSGITMVFCCRSNPQPAANVAKTTFTLELYTHDTYLLALETGYVDWPPFLPPCRWVMVVVLADDVDGFPHRVDAVGGCCPYNPNKQLVRALYLLLLSWGYCITVRIRSIERPIDPFIRRHHAHSQQKGP